jgi:hypothetical protein
MDSAQGGTRAAGKAKLGFPCIPAPREHGAWVIAAVSTAIPLFARWYVGWDRVVAIGVVVVSLFLARVALDRLLTRSRDLGAGFWFALELAVAGAVGAVLIAYEGLHALELPAILAVGLFALHASLRVVPATRRIDRTRWAELFSVAALTLPALASYAVATGRLDTAAWWLWAACAAYFGSGIVFVHMLLDATKVKGAFGWGHRCRVGLRNFAYHALLTAAMIALWRSYPGLVSVYVLIAFAPAIVRAVVGWVALGNKTPPFKVVGMLETAYAVWFAVAAIAALRAVLPAS